LRKLTDEEEQAYAGQLPVPASNDGIIMTTVWVVADERAALDKIKQALRVRKPKQASDRLKDPASDSTAAATLTFRDDDEEEDDLNVELSRRSSSSVPAVPQPAAPNNTLHGATSTQQIHSLATANGLAVSEAVVLPQMPPIALPNIGESHIPLRLQQQQVQELELRHRHEQIQLLHLSQQLLQRHSMLSPLIPQPFFSHGSTLWPTLNPAAAALASIWPTPLAPLPTLVDVNPRTSTLLALNRIQQQQNLQALVTLNQQTQLPPLNMTNQLLLNQSAHDSNAILNLTLNLHAPLSTLLPNTVLGNLDTATAQWLGTTAVPGLGSSGFALASAAVPALTETQAGVAPVPPPLGVATAAAVGASTLQTLSIPPAASSSSSATAARAINRRPSTTSDESSSSSSSKANNNNDDDTLFGRDSKRRG
jgi:hypothetical protein